jgi:hypothetical protein
MPWASRDARRDVTIYDIDPRARSATLRTATVNGVADWVTVLGECSEEDLPRHADPGALFWIDIEGADRNSRGGKGRFGPVGRNAFRVRSVHRSGAGPVFPTQP